MNESTDFVIQRQTYRQKYVFLNTCCVVIGAIKHQELTFFIFLLKKNDKNKQN